MRDGNFDSSGGVTLQYFVVSLPMRDGNYFHACAPAVVCELLAYL